jgi:hypothetical protein
MTLSMPIIQHPAMLWLYFFSYNSNFFNKKNKPLLQVEIE